LLDLCGLVLNGSCWGGGTCVLVHCLHVVVSFEVVDHSTVHDLCSLVGLYRLSGVVGVLGRVWILSI